MFFLLMCISVVSSGEIIFIKGLPSQLEQRGELYYLPPSYVVKPTTTYLFITMDGVNKLCFLNTTPGVMYDRIAHISILMNEMKTDWNCFPYTTTITEARP